MSLTWQPFFFKTLLCQAHGSHPDVYVENDARLFLTSTFMPSTSGETTVFLVHAELRNANGFAPIHASFLVPAVWPEKSWKSYFPLLFPRVLPQCPLGLYCVYEKNVYHDDYVNSFIVVIDDLLRHQHYTSHDNTLLTPNENKVSTIVLDPANAALNFPVHNLQPLLATPLKTRIAAELGTRPRFDIKHNCTSKGCLLNALDVEGPLRTKPTRTNIEYLDLALNSVKLGDIPAIVKAIDGGRLALMQDTVAESKVYTGAVAESTGMAVQALKFSQPDRAAVEGAPVPVGGGPGTVTASHINPLIDAEADTEAFDPAIIVRGPKKGHRHQESDTTFSTQDGSTKGSRGHTPSTSMSSIASEETAFGKDDRVSHTSNNYPKAFMHSESPYAGRKVSFKSPSVISSNSALTEAVKHLTAQPSVISGPVQAVQTRESKPVTKSQRKRGRERKAEKAKKLKEQQLAEAVASTTSSSVTPDTHVSSTPKVKEEEIPETGKQSKQRKKGANNAKLAKKGNVISKAALIAKVKSSDDSLPIKARVPSTSAATVKSNGSPSEASTSSVKTPLRVPSLTEFSPFFTAPPQEMKWEASHNEQSSTEYKFQLTERNPTGASPTPSEKTDNAADPVSVRKEPDNAGSQGTSTSATPSAENGTVKFDVPESSIDFNPQFTAPPQEMNLDVPSKEPLSTEYALRLPQLEVAEETPALVEQVDVVMSHIGAGEDPEEVDFQNELPPRDPDAAQDGSTECLISSTPAHLSWQIIRPKELWRNVDFSNLQEWQVWAEVTRFDEGDYGPFYLIRRMAFHIPSSMAFEDHCEMLQFPTSSKLFFGSLLQSLTLPAAPREIQQESHIEMVTRIKPAPCTKELQRGMDGAVPIPVPPQPLYNLYVSIKMENINQPSGQGSVKGHIEYPLGEVQAKLTGGHCTQDGEDILVKEVVASDDDSMFNDLMPAQVQKVNIVSDSSSSHAGVAVANIGGQDLPKADFIHHTASVPQAIKEYNSNSPVLYEADAPIDSKMGLHSSDTVEEPTPHLTVAGPVVSPMFFDTPQDCDSLFSKSSDDDRSKVLKIHQDLSETVEDSTGTTTAISDPVLISDASHNYDAFVFEFSDDERPKDPTMPQNRPANNVSHGSRASGFQISDNKCLKESTVAQTCLSETVEDATTKAVWDPVLKPDASHGYGSSIFVFSDEECPKDPMMPQNRPTFAEKSIGNHAISNKPFEEFGSSSTTTMVAITDVKGQKDVGKAHREAQNASCRGPNLRKMAVVNVVSPSVTENLDSASDSTIVLKANMGGSSLTAAVNDAGQTMAIDSETINLVNHNGFASRHICLPRLSFILTLLANASRRAANALHNSTQGPVEQQDAETSSLKLENYFGPKTIWAGKQGVEAAKVAAAIALIPADMTIQAAIIPVELMKTSFSIGIWAGSRFGPGWMRKLLEPTCFGTSKRGGKPSVAENQSAI